MHTVPAICVSMLPQYAMVLGYSHTESSFRLLFNLFFHRGSYIIFSSQEDQQDILRIFLAISCGATVAR